MPCFSTSASAAKNILGPKPRQHKINDTEIQLLSEKKHKLRLNFQSATYRNISETIRNERKTLTKLIRKKSK